MVELNVNKILAFALSLVVLFITVYFVAKAWRKGMEGDGLIGGGF